MIRYVYCLKTMQPSETNESTFEQLLHIDRDTSAWKTSYRNGGDCAAIRPHFRSCGYCLPYKFMGIRNAIPHLGEKGSGRTSSYRVVAPWFDGTWASWPSRVLVGREWLPLKAKGTISCSQVGHLHAVRVRRHIRITLGQLDEQVDLDPPKSRLVNCYSAD